MVDYLGNEIKLNQNVVIVSPNKTSKRFVKARVIGFTKKRVIVDYEEKELPYLEGNIYAINKEPDNIIVIK